MKIFIGETADSEKIVVIATSKKKAADKLKSANIEPMRPNTIRTVLLSDAMKGVYV